MGRVGRPEISRFARFNLVSIPGLSAFMGDDDRYIEVLKDAGRLPFVQVPGNHLPKDRVRDEEILAALVRAGVPTRPGSYLPMESTGALYDVVRAYFDDVSPLMQTERWMAEFLERNRMTYVDHDGTTYRIDGRMRRAVPPGAGYILPGAGYIPPGAGYQQAVLDEPAEEELTCKEETIYPAEGGTDFVDDVMLV
jgi:hypothetical protein